MKISDLIPRDYLLNLQWRLYVLLKARNNPELQAALVHVCRLDILFYINTFCYQFDPTKKGTRRIGPFISWPFQERALLDRPETTGRKGVLWCYEKDRSMVVEKSREMGATWLFLIFQDWLCLFHDYVQCLNISRSEKAVESKTKNSLFTKIRFIHEHLPEWASGELLEEKMYFEFKRSRSEITGEASTGKSGVGGRGSVIFIDEFAEIEEDVDVRQKTASTGNCRFFNSTHLGTGTQFYELTQNPDFVKLQMHWTRHPDKNAGLYSYDLDKKKLRFWEYVPATDEIKELDGPRYDYGKKYDFNLEGKPVGGPHPGIRCPWYDWKASDIGSERGTAMQLDMNASGSVSQFFDPLMIRDLKQWCRAPDFEGDIYYDDFGNFTSLEAREGGPLRLWCNLIDGKPPKYFYGIGADVSGGSGATPSCLSITNGQTGEKVGEYFNSRIDPKEFGILSVSLCRFFHGAKIIWEHVGPGVNYGLQIIELGYRNIWMRANEDKLGNTRSETIGWNPVGMTKMLIEYQAALRKREMLNRSARALEECLAFKYDSRGKVIHSGISGDDFSAARENHGDLTVSDGLSWKLVKEEGSLAAAKKNQELTQAINFCTMEYRISTYERSRLEEEVWN